MQSKISVLVLESVSVPRTYAVTLQQRMIQMTPMPATNMPMNIAITTPVVIAGLGGSLVSGVVSESERVMG